MLQANKLCCWKLKQFSKFSVALVAPCVGAKSGTWILSRDQACCLSLFWKINSHQVGKISENYCVGIGVYALESISSYWWKSGCYIFAEENVPCDCFCWLGAAGAAALDLRTGRVSPVPTHPQGPRADKGQGNSLTEVDIGEYWEGVEGVRRWGERKWAWKEQSRKVEASVMVGVLTSRTWVPEFLCSPANASGFPLSSMSHCTHLISH